MDGEKLAIIAIKKYLNRFETSDEEILANFDYAIDLIKSNIDSAIKRDSNISAMTQGSRSFTFNNADMNTIIDSKVRAILPRPYLRVW